MNFKDSKKWLDIVEKFRSWLSDYECPDIEEYDNLISAMKLEVVNLKEAEEQKKDDLAKSIGKRFADMLSRVKGIADACRRSASLHNHTAKGSLLDSIMSPDELVQQAYELGYKSVALTEHGTMYSFIDGYKKAQELGMDFIAGCEVYEVDDMHHKAMGQPRYHLILLAKNQVGLENLFKIVTAGATDGLFNDKPRVDLALMRQYSEGIICMSACLGGRVNRILLNKKCHCCNGEEHTGVASHTPDEQNWELAKEWVAMYREIFGEDYYLELQSHATSDQRDANILLVKLALEMGIKFTITFDTHMHNGKQETRNAHSRWVKTDPKRAKYGASYEMQEVYEGCWQTDLRTVHETLDGHIGYDMVELAIKYTEEVAEKCKIKIDLHQNLMPKITVPTGYRDIKHYLTSGLINEGWYKRGIDKLPPAIQEVYRQRLLDEFEVLDELGYCAYFVMLNMIVNKFKEKKIPLGYSRGSGANSLTLYVIGVTEVDSVRWSLDFSRFANKGRVGSPPDYDLDLGQRRRQEAIGLMAELFGQEYVCQLATFGSATPKVLVKDMIGKVFHEDGVYPDLDYKKREAIAKIIPDEADKDIMIDEAIRINPELAKYEEQYPLLFDEIRILQYLPRNVGTHAAAVLVMPEPVVKYAPLMLNGDGNLTMQLEMGNAMEDIGGMKMDLLG